MKLVIILQIVIFTLTKQCLAYTPVTSNDEIHFLILFTSWDTKGSYDDPNYQSMHSFYHRLSALYSLNHQSSNYSFTSKDITLKMKNDNKHLIFNIIFIKSLKDITNEKRNRIRAISKKSKYISYNGHSSTDFSEPKEFIKIISKRNLTKKIIYLNSCNSANTSYQIYPKHLILNKELTFSTILPDANLKVINTIIKEEKLTQILPEFPFYKTETILISHIIR